MVCGPHLQNLHRVSATTSHFHLFFFVNCPFLLLSYKYKFTVYFILAL